MKNLLGFAVISPVPCFTLMRFENQVPLADGLSLSPDGRWLLHSQTDEENTDIILADHFR
jgi:hypothetical protein